MPPEMVEAFKPEYVAPLIAFLGHEACPETGGIFEVGSGWVAKVRWQRSGGVGFPITSSLLPEQIAQRWGDIVNFDDGRATHPTSTQEAFQQFIDNFNSNTAGEKQQKEEGGLDIEAAKKLQFDPIAFTYTERDVILYALGVGAKRTDLHLVYENSDNFMVLPSFGVVPSFEAMNSVPFGDFLPSFNPVS